MKIATISDIHNNEVNLKKVLDYCAKNKIEKMICCGDLASLETLDFLNDNFRSPTSEAEEVGLPSIYYVFGNMDNDFLKNTFCHPELVSGSKRHVDSGSEAGMTYKKTKIFKEFGEAEIENKNRVKSNDHATRVAFVHKPEEAKQLCSTGKYNFVFYGHTHKPWTENINGCVMLNPGNVANQFYLPTFAIWNTEDGKFELVRINELR